MKRIVRTVVAGSSALAVAGVALALAVPSGASPLGGIGGGGTLECSYQTDPESLDLTGSCGSESALGSTGGSLSGQIDRAGRTAAGEMSLNTTLGSLRGEFTGGLTSGGTIVGEFTPAGMAGIPFVALPG